jgi:AhpD family alkylhydroperoxidase
VIPAAYITEWRSQAPWTQNAWVEQDLIISRALVLAVSVLHECEYCTMGHTFLARNTKLPNGVVEAVRERAPIADERLEACARLQKALFASGVESAEQAVDAFLARGFTREQVLEIVVAIATKTISNYVNHIAHTPKESFMASPELAWVVPRNRKQSM